MGIITKTKTWADAENVTYTDLNADFDTIYNEFNGNIDNANIKAGAGISATKLDSAVITTTGVQTMTNKTLTKPKTIQPYTDLIVAADASTVTFDLETGQLQSVSLGGNRTLALDNEQVGQAFIIRLIQGSGGSKTVTWWTTIKWPGGTAPTLSTTESDVDVFGFIVTASGTYDGYIVGQSLS